LSGQLFLSFKLAIELEAFPGSHVNDLITRGEKQDPSLVLKQKDRSLKPYVV
jgi:hypothetical protein